LPLLDIIDKIKLMLEEIPNIGKVHPAERWTVKWEEFLDFFRPAGENIIKGWLITSTATAEDYFEAPRTNLRTHSIMVQGFYSHVDSAESWRDFIALQEEVCNKLRKDPTLKGSALDSQPPQVSRTTAMLAGVLVHRCEITFETKEKVQY